MPKLMVNSKQIGKENTWNTYVTGDDKVGMPSSAFEKKPKASEHKNILEVKFPKSDKVANLQKKSATMEPVDLYVAAQKKVQARKPSMVNIHFGQKQSSTEFNQIEKP